MSVTYRKLLAYFFRGLLFLTPLAVTVYIIYQLFLFLDNLIPVPIPGIGILMVLALITFVGYLASLFFTKPFEAAYKTLPDTLIDKYGLDAEQLLNEILDQNLKNIK